MPHYFLWLQHYNHDTLTMPENFLGLKDHINFYIKISKLLIKWLFTKPFKRYKQIFKQSVPWKMKQHPLCVAYLGEPSCYFYTLGVATLEGPMYAVGGHDGWSYLNTVERWDPEGRQWNYVASMSTPRSTVGVVALNNKWVNSSMHAFAPISCGTALQWCDPPINKHSRWPGHPSYW